MRHYNNSRLVLHVHDYDKSMFGLKDYFLYSCSHHLYVLSIISYALVTLIINVLDTVQAFCFQNRLQYYYLLSSCKKNSTKRYLMEYWCDYAQVFVHSISAELKVHFKFKNN